MIFFTLSYLFIRRVPWYVLCFFCLYALHCCLKFYSKHVAQHNWACWQLLWEALLLNLTTTGPKPLSNSIRNSKFIICKLRVLRHSCLFFCNSGDNVQYHGGLWSRELGQAPMLQVFLTHRQVLSSHLCQQMVRLY